MTSSGVGAEAADLTAAVAGLAMAAWVSPGGLGARMFVGWRVAPIAARDERFSGRALIGYGRRWPSRNQPLLRAR